MTRASLLRGILRAAGAHQPADIATAVRLVMTENPTLTTLIPHHHRVTPQPGQTTGPEIRAALDAGGI